MESRSLFSIKFVAAHTGLKPHLIRAWESRYQAVVPKRTRTNRRLYCSQDIHRLRLLKMACKAGHQISRMARTSTEELQQILAFSSASDNDQMQAPQATASGPSAEDYRKACLQAVIASDPWTLDQTLSAAAVQLTRRKLVESVIAPLFNRIGELWSSGRLKVYSEHVASACARTLLGDMLRSVGVSPHAPRIVIGTPAGQHHELGALAAAVACAEAGWQPIYVGAGLPAEELASAAEGFGAKCVGLGIAHRADPNPLGAELLNLRRYLGAGRAILIGGLQGARWDDLISVVDAHRIHCWQDIIETLGRLSAP